MEEFERAPESEPERTPENESTQQPQDQPGGDDAMRRRRRGRRGRGGGFGGPRPPYQGQGRPPYQGQGRPPYQGQARQPYQGRPPFQGQGRPPFQGPRPAFPGQPLRGPAPQRDEDEGSSQARELAAYERRIRRQPGGGQPWRSGGAGGGATGWRGPRRSAQGQQRYQETIRRVTAGPRTAAPSHDAGEPIAGPHAVIEAMRAGRGIRRIYVSQDRSLRTGAVEELIAEAQNRRIFVRFVDKLEIARLSPVENHQGVVAIVEGRAGVELDEFLLHLDTLPAPALVLVVDSLQDPQNFGVLLRSAEGAGVDGVVIPHHRSVGLTPAVAKTSAGASEHLLVADVPNLRQAIDALKEKGIWVVAADESGDLLYDEVDYRGPTAIVIGGEGEGIRRLVLEGADQVVRLPMEGQVASLNASAAGTVVLYEALRQRRRDVAPAGTRTPRPVVQDAETDAADDADVVDTAPIENDVAQEAVEQGSADAPSAGGEAAEAEATASSAAADIVGDADEPAAPEEPAETAPPATAKKPKTTRRRATKKSAD